DADNACASAQRALELTLVMDFDERGDLSVTCCRKKSPETRVIQDSYDEENRIRASGTRFPDLLGRDHEILPQHGDVHRSPDRRKVEIGPAEPPLVREHTDRRRSRPGVAAP